MLYHVSRTSGIQVLKPRVSTHGTPYVYAVDNLVTGLLFGAQQDDFDFLIFTDETNTPVVYECYPNAFSLKYQGKSCSVYEIDGEGFQRGVTGWQPELVCEKEVPVNREVFIPDLYQRLMEENAQNKLILHKYENTPEYKRRIAEHVVDRLIRFDALDLDKTDIRFQTHFQKIIQALRSVMDGHLL